ncbi:hypothetical protein PMIN06_001083 [Paraphaeosphaeria minitans]
MLITCRTLPQKQPLTLQVIVIRTTTTLSGDRSLDVPTLIEQENEDTRSNFAFFLPSLSTVSIITIVSTCTLVLFYKCNSDTAEHLIAALKDRHADKKVRLLKEKHFVERQAVELQSHLRMTEAALAMQTRVSQINEERVQNYEGVRQFSAWLIEAD